MHPTAAVRSFVEALAKEVPPLQRAVLRRLRAPALAPLILDRLIKDSGQRRTFAALLSNTATPTVLRAGAKTNVIPGRVDLEVDIRKVPEQTDEDVLELFDTALGSLRGDVEVEFLQRDVPTVSPIDTPLWDAIQRVSRVFYPGASTVPFLTVGATDARYTRTLGSVSYGFGLHSTAIGFEQYGAMFHGIDERVDVESLRLSTEMWMGLARDFLE